ncbi:MAG TPA: hydrogenase maturation nickel metallochaperone HypA [Thermopolyspora sp.]|jgi:Zn finger protein HypA/HybF (possibly regulating hydrogenase expression)
MHEIGMCEGLVDLIEQRAAGRRVAGVRLRVGARHAVLDDAFDQAFALVSDGTCAAGATMDLIVTPATLTCRACGNSTATRDLLAVCGRCGDDDVELTGGDELVLESLLFETGSTTKEEAADVPRHPQ